jgi:hypothetical protein
MLFLLCFFEKKIKVIKAHSLYLISSHSAEIPRRVSAPLSSLLKWWTWNHLPSRFNKRQMCLVFCILLSEKKWICPSSLLVQVWAVYARSHRDAPPASIPVLVPHGYLKYPLPCHRPPSPAQSQQTWNRFICRMHLQIQECCFYLICW